MLYTILPCGKNFGWGVCGKYLTKELARLTRVRWATKSLEPNLVDNNLDYQFFTSLQVSTDERKLLEKGNRHCPVLQAISDHRLEPYYFRVDAPWKVGYTFFEALLSEADVTRASEYFNVIATGSSWCAEKLREKGCPNVATVIQGVDPLTFNPALSAKELFQDRFVIFSGGKFEYRKGQDLVLRAVKVLQDKYPDVILVTSWFNQWPFTIKTMVSSPLIRFVYKAGDYLAWMNELLEANGIDVSRVITLPLHNNETLARIYQNTDIGLFPNRCEGGTNLVLMEYMACGKPVIASDSSGHRDIVNPHNALLIGCSKTVTVLEGDQPYAVWDEPDLDQTIYYLEWAYQHRDRLGRLGQQAGADLSRLTWRASAQHFHRLLNPGSEPTPAQSELENVWTVSLGKSVEKFGQAALGQRLTPTHVGTSS